ncbi:hypothetical protein I7I51_04658 [Histoplasma capsulatum]|uniref:Uncharacterized protein n=1 Tax=Ajellomyces capsulatus TaxID=5037 RepID=A0A8A1M5X8_AJECA|nr:hypothetical protein I7I51_04658 [Histoplasma capsulatum]
MHASGVEWSMLGVWTYLVSICLEQGAQPRVHGFSPAIIYSFAPFSDLFSAKDSDLFRLPWRALLTYFPGFSSASLPSAGLAFGVIIFNVLVGLPYSGWTSRVDIPSVLHILKHRLTGAEVINPPIYLGMVTSPGNTQPFQSKYKKAALLE